jgi:hypothetical protein
MCRLEYQKVDMKYLLVAAALSVGITGASLAQGAGTSGQPGGQGTPSTASGPTATSNGDGTDRAALGANQIVNEADARTAGIKADLHLTPEQQKNWPGFESSLHDIDKARADRRVAFQAERGQKSGDVIDYLNRHAKALDARSADVKKLADAAQPLYASLDEQQKRQFANQLIRLSRELDIDW